MPLPPFIHTPLRHRARRHLTLSTRAKSNNLLHFRSQSSSLKQQLTSAIPNLQGGTIFFHRPPARLRFTSTRDSRADAVNFLSA